jgi:hypothetical protein
MGGFKEQQGISPYLNIPNANGSVKQKGGYFEIVCGSDYPR